MTSGEYQAQKASELIGGTVVGVFTDPNGEYWGVDVLHNGTTLHIWVNCDPEGNGPGAFDIESIER